MTMSETFLKHRPGYHFRPAKNWMNDPNGLIQFKGEYHLFYQHNPHGAGWGNMTWGHAVSRDLVRWKHLPLALHPDQPYDREGVYSGCAVDDNGVAAILYTGVNPQTQCLATSQDMIKWKKYAGNPILSGPPAGYETPDFRDPFVWKENDTWYMVVGSDVKGVGGIIFLYRSKDLRQWEYLNPLCEGRKEETGEIWECPNFFPLGDKWVLMISPIPFARAIYFVGRYENFKFTPEYQGEIDQGGAFYAPQTFLDDRGRRIMFGWAWEGRKPEAQIEAGWAGVMTLPRVLTLGSDNTLRYEVAEEFKTLRRGCKHLFDVRVDTQGINLGSGESVEIALDVEHKNAEKLELKVRCSPDADEETVIRFNGGTLWTDWEHSSIDPAALPGKKGTNFTLAEGENLKLHVFVDRSIIEVYANDRACLTSRIYPARKDSTGIKLLTRNGEVLVRTAEVWDIEPVWADVSKIS